MSRSPLTAALTRTALGLCVLTASGAVAGPVAHAGAGDGALTVRVVRSIAGDGAYDPAVDVGIPNAAVHVTDASGHVVTGTTGPGGTLAVQLTGLSGGRYRVQVTAPNDSALVPAPAGRGLSPLTDSVDVSGGKSATPVMGLWKPDTYCQSDPTLVSCNLQRGDRTAGLGLFAFHGDSGTSTTAPGGPYTQLSKTGDQGAVFGIGTDRSGNVYAGTYVKRHTEYGPKGNVNEIYRYNVNDPAAGVTPFIQLPGTLTKHVEFDIFDPANRTPYIDDNDVYGKVGEQGLGGVAVSGDGSTLYAVDLNDDSLYRVPLNGSGAAVTPGTATGTPIPRPAANCNGTWHPFGLGVSGETLYVGGICGAENTVNPFTPWGDPSQEYAFVYRYFNGAFTEILDFPMNFPRGCAYQYDGTAPGNCRPQPGGVLSADWEAWNERTPTAGKFGFTSAPQPMLTSIDVTDDGGLDLGFRDRYPDMEGSYLHRHNDGTDQAIAIGAGDLLRACVSNGTYRLENDGTCGGATGAAPGNGFGPGGGEFFTSIVSGSDSVDDHTATGGTTYNLGYDQEWSTRYTPFGADPWHKGVSLYAGTGSASTGIEVGGSQLAAGTDFGDGNGVADLEKLCDAAPVQIGARVWFDADRDGIQGPAEPGVAGVKVTLESSGGTSIATTTTDATGAYYFGTADGVKPNAAYSLKFDYSAATALPAGLTPADVSWTRQNAGTDHCLSSSVTPAGLAAVTVGAAGDVDHCIDAGLIGPPNAIGARVWYDTHGDGVYEPGDPGIGGVKATLENAAGTAVATTTTDVQGLYDFQGLPDGRYRVCFDRSTLPALYTDGTFTKPNTASAPSTGTSADTDSKPDPSTGCTGYVTVNPRHETDTTLTAGIVTPKNAIDDRVRLDTRHDGAHDAHDAADPGVPGIQVRLMSSTGYVAGAKTTDAQGAASFTDLPNGTYRICFVQDTYPAGDAIESGANPQTGCTVPVTLGPGHRTATLDAALTEPATSQPGPIGMLARTGLDLPTTGLLMIGLGSLVGAAYLLLRRRNGEH
ncbi:MAG TPA: SdrD B-like domain-containing protein [Actinospica sp.]|nr:SdrD B-like domain-containing protein [Actinospica sp.]